jgi:hypothetical protein
LVAISADILVLMTLMDLTPSFLLLLKIYQLIKRTSFIRYQSTLRDFLLE